MIKDYSTKNIKKTPTKDGQIFKQDGVWKFKWKGSECGYMTKTAAEEGLAKVSSTVEEET
tara:strand:+ start:180 stop:359 length:180 start_codon:yes stop_codon:yes gene_type:complete